MAATRAATNKKVRQEALREQLSKQGHVQQVIKNIKKFEEQGVGMEATELNALKAATDTRLKLISKYLPDLKQQEITIEADIVAKEATRAELEEELKVMGISLDSFNA
jgi:hypothetical protein